MAKEQQWHEAEMNQLISFGVGKEEYGVDILRVKEVIRVGGVTRLPKAPTFIKGIINLRGDIIPIVDLRDRFGLPEMEDSQERRVIVVDIEEKLVGMVVDTASQVVRVPSDQIEPPPPIVGGLSEELIHGVAKLGDRLVILLNIDKVLSNQEISALEGLQGSPSEKEAAPVT